MKRSVQTLNEVAIAGLVLTAAGVALILMVGHAVWKQMVNESSAVELPPVAVCADPRILPPGPAAGNFRSVRKECHFADHRALSKRRWLRHYASARQQRD